jgi:hypothetical protein
MPNNLVGDDGKLIFKLDDNTTHSILPEVGDLLIFPTTLLHAPMTNTNSDIERIVVAGVWSHIDTTIQMSNNNTVGSTSFIGDGNIIYNTIFNAAAEGDLIYLNTNKPLKADIVTVPNQFTFTGASLLNPPTGSQLPATTISNFTIYVNGQYIPSAFASITSDVGGITFQVITGSIGYSLETDDEVIAIGKFK